jgi:hypothetical protein
MREKQTVLGGPVPVWEKEKRKEVYRWVMRTDPGPPEKGKFLRGTKFRGTPTWQQHNLKAPPEQEPPPDRQLRPGQLPIRRVDQNLIPQLPEELAYKGMRVGDDGAARAFVTGKEKVELRSASTKFTVHVHDCRF